MEISRVCPFTDRVHTMNINITQKELDALVKTQFKWYHPTLAIQDFLPRLSVDEREFIMTGITPDEWDKAMLDGL